MCFIPCSSVLQVYVNIKTQYLRVKEIAHGCFRQLILRKIKVIKYFPTCYILTVPKKDYRIQLDFLTCIARCQFEYLGKSYSYKSDKQK